MSQLPKLGVMMFATRTTMPLPRLAERVEALGFESLFLPEHPIIPERFDSEYPGGGPLPDEYRMMVDPYVGLAAAAGPPGASGSGPRSVSSSSAARSSPRRPSRPSTGSRTGGWCSASARGGSARRATCSMWTGSGAATQMGEFVAAMKTCWTDEVSSFNGRYVRFPEVIVEPKPVQRPHPPILVAGELALAAKRAAEWGSGWMPRYLWSTPEMVEDGRRRMEEPLGASAAATPRPSTSPSSVAAGTATRLRAGPTRG